MVTSQGTRNVISEYDLFAQVGGVERFTDTQLRGALQALAQESKLVRRVILREAPYYEIISEFLAPWIAKLRREREGARAERARQFEERSLRLAKFTRFALALGALLALFGMGALVYNTYRSGTISKANERMREAELLSAEASRRAAYAAGELEKLRASLEVLDKKRDKAEAEMMLAERRTAEAQRLASLLVPKANRERLQHLEGEVASLVEQTGDLKSQIEEKEQLIKALQTSATTAAAGGTQTSSVRAARASTPRRSDKEKRSPAMFGSAMLEVAAALLMMYLILGLVCIALGELFESFLNFRAAYLYRGIRGLLGDESDVKLLYNHPLVRALQGKGGHLSYLPPRTFSSALLDMIAPATLSGARHMGGVREGIAAMENLDLRRSLLALFYGTEETEQARERIEAWYEEAMDRVSGRYRRRVGLLLLALAYILSLGLNVDTVNIATTLSRTELRNVVAAAAESYVTAPAPDTASVAPTTGPTPAVDPPNPVFQAREAARRINAVRSEVDELGLPIGWTSDRWGANPRGVPATPTGWVLKTVGCLITALVVSQFALFLFDIFNRFAVIRATVRPREHGLGRPPSDAGVKATSDDE
jgi:hypothetical protein